MYYVFFSKILQGGGTASGIVFTKGALEFVVKTHVNTLTKSL